MLTLTRNIRFSLTRTLDRAAVLNTPRGNTHAGWPSMDTLAGSAWEATIEVRGLPDPRTGYLVGIDQLDLAVRTRSIPRLLEAHAAGECSAVSVARTILETAGSGLTVKIHAVEVEVEPKTRWRVESGDMSMVLIQRRYEFSASHRLHLPELDDAANEALFGKCSNPNGHGHNYEVEVRIETRDSETPLSILAVDDAVNSLLIDRFDHKHLNLDVDDFKERVPSVENIASRCVELLREPISALGSDSRLHAVKVWETPRTACTVLA
mgnify:CR=1 FL=1